MTMEQQIQQQVRQLEEKMNLVGSNVSKVDNNVSQILMVLVGNSFDKDDRGLIGQVNDLEARVIKGEEWMAKVTNMGLDIRLTNVEERVTKGEKWRTNISNRVLGFIVGMSAFAGVGLREIIGLIFKQ